jgi:Flp pilus assembly protein TadD
MNKHQIELLLASAKAHHQSGRFKQAEESYRQVLEQEQANPEALQLLGSVLAATDRAAEGVELIRQAIAIDPAVAQYYCNLGTALLILGEIDEAIDAHQKAISLRPDFVLAWDKLANARIIQGKPDQAIAPLRHAISKKPQDAPLHCRLAQALEQTGDFELARESYLCSISLNPKLVVAHLGYAHLLWEMGQQKASWNEFLKATELHDPLADHYPSKKWPGDDPTGKRILVYASGTFGDTLWQARCVPMLMSMGAQVYLQCQAELVSLLARLGAQNTFSTAQSPPQFDQYAILGNLPAHVGLNPFDRTGPAPYLFAPSPQAWGARIKSDGKMKIGLAWAGGNAVHRSGSMSIFAPLAQVSNLRFFSLQVGRESRQTPPNGMEIIDYTPQIRDFGDTASLIEHLDLVISVDSAVMHLAGAMGKPVWALIPRHPAMPWVMEGPNSPWYPTLRLFRQHQVGDWDQPIRQMAQELSAKIGDV